MRQGANISSIAISEMVVPDCLIRHPVAFSETLPTRGVAKMIAGSRETANS
jgi:hypothetical protein